MKSFVALLMLPLAAQAFQSSIEHRWKLTKAHNMRSGGLQSFEMAKLIDINGDGLPDYVASHQYYDEFAGRSESNNVVMLNNGCEWQVESVWTYCQPYRERKLRDERLQGGQTAGAPMLIADELYKLKDLMDEGILSKAEFEIAKSRLLQMQE